MITMTAAAESIRITARTCSSIQSLRAVRCRSFLNYQTPMRYFFHIFDGAKVFPDEEGIRLSSTDAAISQARVIAAELSKAGEFCRSNLVLVLDENGKDIFQCRAL